MNKNRKKYLLYLLALLLLFTASWLSISRFYDQQVLSQHESFLEQKTRSFIRLTVHNETDFDDLATDYVNSSDERITYLNQNGTILFDTSDQKLRGNRSTRPEVKAVLTGNPVGRSLRKSPTLNKEMLYIAVPIKKQGEIIRILRMAEPTTSFLPEAQRMKQAIFLVNFIFWLILSLLILGILWRQNRSVETILPVIKQIINEPEEQQIILQNSSQWQELYRNINLLSRQMSDTYQAFSSSEKQFYTLLDDLMIGVFMIDEKDQLTFVNKALKNQLNLVQVKLKETYSNTLTDPQLIQLIHQTSQNQLLRKKVRTKNSDRLLDITIRRFKDSGQSIGLTYDLTRITQLEKSQNDFVSNVSHELKTPITSLIGFAETLIDGAKEDPEMLTEFLKIIQKDAYRLKNLVEEILLLSKDGTMDYPTQTIDINKLIRETSHDYDKLIREKQLTMKIVGIKELFISSKLELLKPILKNLIENAIAYTPASGNIQITCEKDEHQLYISVADNGIGISSEEQKRIFERFYRVSKDRSRASGGTGLGLSIVKDYTEQLGGNIHLKSHLGLGSTFILTLPL